MTCAFLDEPCDRTDIRARGLCPKHYTRACRAKALTEYRRTQRFDLDPPLTCQCDPPPFGDECPTCHKLVLTLADDRGRIDYLRARSVR